MLWAVAVAVSCLLILPNMSEENAAGECAGDWFASPHGAYFWCMGALINKEENMDVFVKRAMDGLEASPGK